MIKILLLQPKSALNSLLCLIKTELIILVTPTLSRPDKDSMKLQKSIAETELTDGEEFFIDQKLKRPTFSIRNVVDGLGISGEFGHILSVQARDR